MTSRIVLDPATRLEGHLKVQIQSAHGAVVAAHSGGMLFRGFENILVGQHPHDAVIIAQRVCGICPISHAVAACQANEAAAAAQVPANARLIRSLIQGANFLQSHLLHFYQLALLSYVRGPAIPPWSPAWDVDMRFDAAQSQQLFEHYRQALAIQRQIQEMAALLAGKMPHAAVFKVGGVAAVPGPAAVDRFRAHLGAVSAFVDAVYLPDVALLGQVYPEYFGIGRGYANLLAFGAFESGAGAPLFPAGRADGGSPDIRPISLDAIAEQTRHAWYGDPAEERQPSAGLTQPLPDKADAYSWIKAPRYGGAPYETGPLARMWVRGDYRRGVSVMDRHAARAHEARLLARAMGEWIDQIDPAAPGSADAHAPADGVGVGITEAPRGALGHWLRVARGATASYQILSPTCWNCSPRDNAGVPGPLERALEGTPVLDAERPIEALRVVQSYDPCLACAVH